MGQGKENDGIKDARSELCAARAILQLSPSPISPGTPSSTIASSSQILSPWKTTVTKKKLHNLKASDEKWGKLKKSLKGKIHHAKPLSRQILGTAISRTSVSLYDAEVLCSASIRAFLHNAGFDSAELNMEIAQSCTPSRATFGEFIDETAAEKLGWLREKVVGLEVFLAADKGHKKG